LWGDGRYRIKQTGQGAFYIQNGWRKYHIVQGHEFKAMKGLVYRFYVVPNGRVPIILSVESLAE
jgi:hypothetical protein